MAGVGRVATGGFGDFIRQESLEKPPEEAECIKGMKNQPPYTGHHESAFNFFFFFQKFLPNFQTAAGFRTLVWFSFKTF